MSQMTPWEMQNRLMEISNQNIAAQYEVTNTSFLYAALILEEVSEMMKGLENVLDREDENEHQALIDMISHSKCFAHDMALDLREELTKLGSFKVVLNEAEAIELADATTDITVVNCGFAVATGFNGDACYQDVAGSNLSKANPVTGVIDKDPSGKWIKGVNYKEPNLKKVLYPNV